MRNKVGCEGGGEHGQGVGGAVAMSLPDQRTRYSLPLPRPALRCPRSFSTLYSAGYSAASYLGGPLRDWEGVRVCILESRVIVCSTAMLRIDFQQGQGEMSCASAWGAMWCMELEQCRHTLDCFASGAEDRDAPHNLTLAVRRHVVRCVDERGGTSDPGCPTTIKC